MVRHDECQPNADWVTNPRGFLIAWRIPVLAMIAGGFLDPWLRMLIWVLALTWMGSACLMNSRHCNRTHCKFTGPFFLLMAVPVISHGSGVFSFGVTGWWWLGMITLIGSAVIWWGSEALLGKYRI